MFQGYSRLPRLSLPGERAALPRPRIQLEGADGMARRAAQQRLLSLLEIPAA